MTKRAPRTFYWLVDLISLVMIVPLASESAAFEVGVLASMMTGWLVVAFFTALMAVFSPGFRHLSRWCALIAAVLYLSLLPYFGRELDPAFPALYLLVQIFIPRIPVRLRSEEYVPAPRTITVRSNLAHASHKAPAMPLSKEDLWRRPLYTAEAVGKSWSLRLPKLDLPPLTVAIILLNIVLFFVGWKNAPDGFTGMSMREFTLETFPLAAGRQSLNSPAEWWHVLAASFFHWSVGHLAVNMAFLFWLGRVLEPTLHPVRYLFYYVGGGFVATAFGALALESRSLVAGASGAVYVLIGAYVTFLVLHYRVLDLDAKMRWFSLLFVVLYTAYTIWRDAEGVASNISHAGHIGGLIAGILLVLVFGPHYTVEAADPSAPQILTVRTRSLLRR